MNRLWESPPQGRTLRYSLALAVVLLSVVLGLTYQSLWSQAAEDISRLLPANTKLYLQLEAPTQNLLRAGRLTGGIDAKTSAELYRGSPLLKRLLHDWTGLPIELGQELLRSTESIELAVVPTAQGQATLLFLEISESLERKRVTTRLRSHLEIHERHTGFRIDRIERPLWDQLVEPYLKSPSVLEMDPWLVFAWGPTSSVHDLLNARVGGRHDTIARRPGFVVGNTTTQRDHFRLSTDIISAYEFLYNRPLPPGSLFESLDLITLETGFSLSGQEYLSLSLNLSDSELIARLHRVLNGRTHTQLQALPETSTAALSASSLRLGQLLSLIEELNGRLNLGEDKPQPFRKVLSRLSALHELLSEQAGELLLLQMQQPESELVTLRTTSAIAFEGAFSDALLEAHRDELSVGEVYLEDETLHLARTHEGVTEMFWRLREDTFEFSNSYATLTHVKETPLRPFSFEVQPGVTSEPPAPLRVFLLPDALENLPLRQMRQLLGSASNMPLSLSLSMRDDQLHLEASIGLWTTLLTAFAASEDTLNQLQIQALEPSCQEAYRQFCRAWPEAYPCIQLHYHMRLWVAQMCQEMALPSSDALSP